MKKSKYAGTHSLVAAIAVLGTPLATAQLDNGLVAYWPFDGDLQDASATGAHGTANLGTAAVPGISYAACQFGNGVFLNNFLDGEQENQYIEILGVPENTFDFTGGSMSVSFWVKESYYLGADRTIVGKGTGNSWRMNWTGTSEVDATLSMFGGLGTAATGDGLDMDHVLDNAIHHVVGVVEAGVGIRLYYDGQPISTVVGNPQLADSALPMTIGALPGTAGSFSEGIIDDMGIWNRALSPAEISLLWNGGTGVTIADAINPADTDEDGLPDFYEDTNGLNKNDPADAAQGADDGLFDNDGLTNLEEFNAGTDPNNADSDSDVLKDGEEVSGSRNPFLNNLLRDPFNPATDPPGDPTDPLNNDSDGDGHIDVLEVLGLRNVAFGRTPSDPNNPDTDGDGVGDKEETDFGFDPNDPASIPPPFQIGLRGYWPFENDLIDASGQRRDGELLEAGLPAPIGNLQYLTIGAKPGFGTCILNDGRTPTLGGPGQSIQIKRSEDAMDFPGGSVTASAWVYLYAQNATPPSIVSKGTGTNWNVSLEPTNQARYETGANAISGGGNIASPVWHHVVAVTEAGVANRLYVDGLLAAVGDAASLGSNGLPMQIGGNPEVADNTWYGLMDEVAVWGRAMDDGEVRQLWNDGDGILVSDLITGTDTDSDGMTDSYETAHGLNPNFDDSGDDLDGDNLTNKQEHDAGSDPDSVDTDGDGLNDDAELAAGTSTLTPDTDGDGLTDGEEISGSRNPYLSNVYRDPFDPMTDPPGDPTNPLITDTDGDQLSDFAEINAGSDPNDSGSIPSLQPAMAYWSFDDGKSPTADLVGNVAGSVNNAIFVPGHSGRPGDLAIDFNGTSSSVTTNVSLLSGRLEYTVAGWVHFTESQGSAGFFGQNDTVEFGMNNATNIHYWMAGPGAINYTFGPTSNGWRHIAIVSSTTERSLYIDGTAVATGATISPTASSNFNFNIGGGGIYGPTGNFFKGRIDDVAMWDVALAQGDIELLASGAVDPLGRSTTSETDEAPVITSIDFVGNEVHVSVEGMDPAETYVLRRSLDAMDFSTAVGTPSTGAETDVFIDTTLPPDTPTAFYQLWLEE